MVGFDVNLDLVETFETACYSSDYDGANPSLSDLAAIPIKEGSEPKQEVPLGDCDFLRDVVSFYSHYSRLLPRRGEALLHNYVATLPGYLFFVITIGHLILFNSIVDPFRYENKRALRIFLALALELAKSNNFHQVIAISGGIDYQKICEKLGFMKIGEVEYPPYKSLSFSLLKSAFLDL